MTQDDLKLHKNSQKSQWLQTDGRTDQQTDGRTDGRTEDDLKLHKKARKANGYGLMDGWMDRRTDEHSGL